MLEFSCLSEELGSSKRLKGVEQIHIDGIMKTNLNRIAIVICEVRTYNLTYQPTNVNL